MDTTTQIFIGAVIADLLGRKTFSRKAFFIGAGCNLLLDVISFLPSRYEEIMLNHAQHWSHTPAAILALGIVFTAVLSIKLKNWQQIGILVFTILTVHVVLDTMSTNGILLLYPFSHSLFHIECLAHFEPILFVGFLLGAIIAYKKRNLYWNRRILIFGACYLIFSYALSMQAKRTLTPMLNQMGFSRDSLQITNVPYIFLLRRVTAKDARNRFAIAYFGPFSLRPPRIWVRKSEVNAQTKSLLQSSLGQNLLYRSHSMVFVERVNNRYIFSDVRHGSFSDPWFSPYQAQSTIMKGVPGPLFYTQSYSRNTFFDDIDNGWQLLLH